MMFVSKFLQNLPRDVTEAHISQLAPLVFDMVQEDINFDDGFRFGLKNRNLYFNGSYKDRLADQWKIMGGLSYTNDVSKVSIVEDRVKDEENSVHAKVKLQHKVSNRFKLNFGTEYFLTVFKENFDGFSAEDYQTGFTNNILGVFAESDIFFSKKLAAKIGIRAENSKLQNDLLSLLFVQKGN